MHSALGLRSLLRELGRWVAAIDSSFQLTFPINQINSAGRFVLHDFLGLQEKVPCLDRPLGRIRWQENELGGLDDFRRIIKIRKWDWAPILSSSGNPLGRISYISGYVRINLLSNRLDEAVFVRSAPIHRGLQDPHECGTTNSCIDVVSKTARFLVSADQSRSSPLLVNKVLDCLGEHG